MQKYSPMKLETKLLICSCKESETQWRELDEKYVNVIIRRMLMFADDLRVICNSKDITDLFKISNNEKSLF